MMLKSHRQALRQASTQLKQHCRGGPSRLHRLAVSEGMYVTCLPLMCRAYDTVDVEPERIPPPNASPGRWGAPPPPPPPPQPNFRRSPQTPSRREALFGFLGAGIGTAITAAYYNSQYDLSDDSYEKALDALLDNPDFLSTVEDEVLYKVYGNQLDELGENLENMQSLDRELMSLKDDLERISTEGE